MSRLLSRGSTPGPGADLERIDAVPVRHPWRWVGAAFILLVLVMVIQSMTTNEKFYWETFRTYLFDVLVIQGVGWTLVLTVSSMAIAIVLAILLAFMRQSENPLFRYVAWVWVWFFRGTPVYTQLLFWGSVGVLYPKIILGVPFGPELFSWDTSTVITATVGAIVGLGLNESAYLAEIFRAGLKSVDNGQMEAAEALGMRRSKVMWRIILPQAMRVIIPPTGNETIGMLKTTSLVLAVPFTLDLTFVTNALASRTFLPIPLLMVAAFWYLLITSVLMVGQFYVERHFGKGIDNVMKAPVKATAAAASAHATPEKTIGGTTEGGKQ
ncbi:MULTISPECIES: amino acid ABC transporter permease [Arthrobacter]|uniref:amino acid ABC transporter permease n=1 Tax=unclassified Arthrobacter TaxID=235627 RepID=UPI0024BAFC26|nr:amino acid ABC transporter permease [Arthrobacter sp. H35-MC1]MDJ0316908.1 amino acid ABC transporter permease [Arthrobacter sp. H35-MC1]